MRKEIAKIRSQAYLRVVVTPCVLVNTRCLTEAVPLEVFDDRLLGAVFHQITVEVSGSVELVLRGTSLDVWRKKQP